MRRRGQTLVATLAVLAIIAILVVVTLGPKQGGSSRKDGKGETVLGAAKLEAVDTKCQSNLGQCRSGIQIARINADDAPPATLEEIRIGADFYKCPLGKEPYAYDPATGEVRCVHPGHEKY